MRSFGDEEEIRHTCYLETEALIADAAGARTGARFMTRSAAVLDAPLAVCDAWSGARDRHCHRVPLRLRSLVAPTVSGAAPPALSARIPSG
jgi:hypothetical protein